MYRPAQYAIDARTDLHGVIRAFPFAVIALGAAGRVELAYAPVVLDESSGKFGGIRFHLARANPITNLLTTCEVLASFRGPDAYISPDWYQSRSVVPTWNYVAVEGRGPARRLEDAELRVLLEDLSEQEIH